FGKRKRRFETPPSTSVLGRGYLLASRALSARPPLRSVKGVGVHRSDRALLRVAVLGVTNDCTNAHNASVAFDFGIETAGCAAPLQILVLRGKRLVTVPQCQDEIDQRALAVGRAEILD